MSKYFKILIFVLISTVSCDTYEVEDFSSDLAESISLIEDTTRFYPTFNKLTKHYAAKTTHSSDEIKIKSKYESEIYVNGNLIGVGEANFNIGNKNFEESLIVTFKFKNQIEAYYIHIIDESIPDIVIEEKLDGHDKGFYIMSTNYKHDNITYGILLIINNDGVPIYRKRVDNRVTDFKQHSNGMYSYVYRKKNKNDFGFWNNEIVILDNELNEIDRVETIGLNHTDNHDFIITNEQTYILMSYNSSYRDLSEFGLSNNQLTRDSVIQEISKSGDVIFEWNSYDYLNISDCLVHRFPDDYAHINSIFLDNDSNIIASFRGCSMVLKINRKNGNVIWSIGGSNPSLKIVNDPFNEVCGQHTASISKDGLLTIFDNGGHCNFDRENIYGRFSRAVSYKLDIENSEAVFDSHFLIDNSKNYYSISGGSFYETRNGNWLINWSRGVNYPMTEVNANSMSIVMKTKLVKDKRMLTNYRINRIYKANIPIKINDYDIIFRFDE